jgi:hypothetical protein
MTITLGRFAKFPRASPLGIPQTCLGLRGHSITNLPQAMLFTYNYRYIVWHHNVGGTKKCARAAEGSGLHFCSSYIMMSYCVPIKPNRQRKNLIYLFCIIKQKHRIKQVNIAYFLSTQTFGNLQHVFLCAQCFYVC